MKPIAKDFGPVALPPTDRRYVDGASGNKVPSVTGLKLDAARKRLQDAGFVVADQPTPIDSYLAKGAIAGTTPKDKAFPGSIVTINTSSGVAPPPTFFGPPDPPPDAPPPPDAAAAGRERHSDSRPAADNAADAAATAATAATPDPGPPPGGAPPPFP